MLTVGSLVFGFLAAPFLSMSLGFSDYGNYPEDKTVRRAYDLIAEGFGPGTNGPLLVVVELPEPNDQAVLESISTALGKTPGVERVIHGQELRRVSASPLQRLPCPRVVDLFFVAGGGSNGPVVGAVAVEVVQFHGGELAVDPDVRGFPG